MTQSLIVIFRFLTNDLKIGVLNPSSLARNNNLAKAHLQNAKETLELMKDEHKSKLWQATHKHYFLYFCAYTIIIKIGIKSEIHDCTITLIQHIEKENHIRSIFGNILTEAKKQRINNQ